MGIALSAVHPVQAIPLGNPLKTLGQLQDEAYAEEAPADDKQKQIEQEIEQGALLYREGNLAEAIRVWGAVLEKDPNNATAKNYIERATKKLMAEKAEVAAPAATTENPAPAAEAAPAEDPIGDWLKEGVDFYRDGKYSEAIAAWNKVLVKDPQNERARRYIERALKKQAELAAATTPAPSPVVAPLPAPEPPPAAKVPEKIEPPAPVPAAKPAPPSVLKQPEPPPAPAPEPPPAPAPEPAAPKVRATLPALLPTPAIEGEVRDYGMLSLQKCILLALSNYGPAKISREEVKLAKMRLIEARRAAYPSVNLKNGITEGTSTDEAFEGLEFTAEFQMPIFSGGRIKNSIRQAEANLAVAIRNYEKIRADYVAEVEQAHYALANAKKFYRDRQQLLKDSDRILDITRKQFDQGLARQLDLLNVESQYSEIEFQITSSEKDLQLAFLTLKQLMNLQDNETFDIEELGTYTVISVDYNQIVKLALERRPDIRLAELQVLFNKYAVKVAESRNRFRADINASVGLNDQFFVESDKLDLQTEFFVGIKATKPLGLHTIENNFILQDKVPAAGQTTSSQFGSNTVSIGLFNNTAATGVTEAKIGYYRAREEMEKGKKTTRFEVQQNFFEYQKGLAQLEGAITRLKLGEEEVKILKAQAELNQAQLIDVMRAMVRYYDAKGNYGQSVTSYYTAMANLNKAVGIIGYFNPVTGEVSEAFHRTLAKPINKPRFRVFTQLTKDRPEEDILTFPPDKVTAEVLLEKERRRNDKFEKPFAPLGAVPGATFVFTPNDTKDKFLSTYYLPPEKEFKPMKPWQILRYPVLGLFEYEQILDPEEPYQTEEKPKAPDTAPARRPEKKEPAAAKQEEKKKPAAAAKKTASKMVPEIRAVEVSESADFVRIALDASGPLGIAPYQLKDPDRILFVLDNPARNPNAIKGMLFEHPLLKSVRLNMDSGDKISAFALDLAGPMQYRVDAGNRGAVILLEKPPKNK